jgi:hypothetical protein
VKRREREKARVIHVILVVVFFAALWTSPLQSLLGFADEGGMVDNRRLASLPPGASALSLLVDHRSELSGYVRDHFGLRHTFVRWHNRFKLWAFGKSPVPRVIVGRDGWLFRGEHSVLDDYRPMNALPDYLVERWRRPIHELRELLDERGIPLLVVVAPSKQTIYPEFLPDGVRSFEQSPRVDQMLEQLSRPAPLAVADLRSVVREAKRRHRTFDRTDTHWNELGAYAGYVAIVEKLSAWLPQLEPRPLSDFRIDRVDEPGGDLARMLTMGDIFREESLSLVPLSPRRSSVVELERPFETPPTKGDTSFIQDGPDLPRAVIFHDSFANRLIPLLAEHFSRLDCRHLRSRRGGRWDLAEDLEVIDAARPDVVIWEIAERAFQRRTDREGWKRRRKSRSVWLGRS